MIRSIVKELRTRQSIIKSAMKLVPELTKVKQLLFNHQIMYGIIQSSKRLQTFSIPQQQQIKPIDKELFNNAVLRKLIQIQSAFLQILNSPTNQLNPLKIKEIKKNNLYSLQIITDKGTFTFEGIDDLSTLYYTSPVTGAYKYFYASEEDRFLNNKDKHILDECLTREVLEKFSIVLEL